MLLMAAWRAARLLTFVCTLPVSSRFQMSSRARALLHTLKTTFCFVNPQATLDLNIWELIFRHLPFRPSFFSYHYTAKLPSLFAILTSKIPRNMAVLGTQNVGA